MANPTVGQVCGKAAGLLNDVAQGKYTNQVLLPHVQQAQDELEEELRLNGVPASDTISTTLTVGPGVLVIKYTGTTPTLPANLIEPIRLREKSASQSIFSPMVRTLYIPSMAQSATLRWWQWEEQALKFVGANQSRDILIDYQWGFPVLDNPVNANQIIPHNASILFLGTKTAALAALLIAQNSTRAAALQDEASNHLSKLIKRTVRGGQALAVRRRPFTNPLRSYGGRYRR